MLIVAIQGYPASFHDVAARQMIGQDFALLPCDTFTDVFERVQNGGAEYGVVAIENTAYGVIHESYNLLLKADIDILDEDVVRVEQCLLGVPRSKLQDITQVYSHPVALMQCADYLQAHLPTAHIYQHADTAGAAADVQSWGDVSQAAIASQAAAKHYGLQVLAADIATEKQNYTRFVLFRKASLSRKS